MTTETFTEWTEFLDALREDRLRWEEGAQARVVYDSSYTDEDQVLEGEVERVAKNLGKSFHLDGKHVIGWHVQSGEDDRTIGHAKTIEFEVKQ